MISYLWPPKEDPPMADTTVKSRYIYNNYPVRNILEALGFTPSSYRSDDDLFFSVDRDFSHSCIAIHLTMLKRIGCKSKAFDWSRYDSDPYSYLLHLLKSMAPALRGGSVTVDEVSHILERKPPSYSEDYCVDKYDEIERDSLFCVDTAMSVPASSLGNWRGRDEIIGLVGSSQWFVDEVANVFTGYSSRKEFIVSLHVIMGLEPRARHINVDTGKMTNKGTRDTAKFKHPDPKIPLVSNESMMRVISIGRVFSSDVIRKRVSDLILKEFGDEVDYWNRESMVRKSTRPRGRPPGSKNKEKPLSQQQLISTTQMSFPHQQGVVEAVQPKMKRRPIPQNIRIKVWKREFGDTLVGKCHVCQIRLEISQWEAGHIISVFNGGPDSMENLTPLCFSCNRSMSSLNMNEYIMRYYEDHPSLDNSLSSTFVGGKV